MALRTFTDKNGNVWEWNETLEVIKALKEYHQFAGNYPEPLYAPNPELKDKPKSN